MTGRLHFVSINDDELDTDEEVAGPSDRALAAYERALREVRAY